MNFIKGEIEGLIEIQPRIFEDDRGLFFESYNKKVFEDNGLFENFVQDNQSLSVSGVLRGLHFQNPPFAQGKLVSVSKGRVLDVAVDIRKDSSTFGKYQLFELDDRKRNMVYIPAGFAHGFLAIEESIFCYKCTNLYNKQSEGGIRWDDPDLNINWGVRNPIVSEKDTDLPTFSQLTKSLD
jgi:dTDP-4-dehydrorhamnose 3,5-epimerase